MGELNREPAWRIRAVSASGALILSVAFCLAALFASCGGGDGETATESEPVEMRGFFLSVNADGEVDCQSEELDVYYEGDESTGRVNVRIPTTSSAAFEQETGHLGQKITAADSGGNIKSAFVTSYVARNSDGSFDFPGLHYLTSVAGEGIDYDAEAHPPERGGPVFAGFWIGETFRPPGNPFVMCPYVMAPRDARSRADEAPLGCGGADGKNMSPELRTYLGPNPPDATGNLGNCYRLLDGNGKLTSPAAVR